jgi:hypothetical protein
MTCHTRSSVWGATTLWEATQQLLNTLPYIELRGHFLSTAVGNTTLSAGRQCIPPLGPCGRRSRRQAWQDTTSGVVAGHLVRHVVGRAVLPRPPVVIAALPWVRPPFAAI